MPEELNFQTEVYDQLALLAHHLFERLDTLNANLHVIAECLDGIEKRLTYAAVLDSQN